MQGISFSLDFAAEKAGFGTCAECAPKVCSSDGLGGGVRTFRDNRTRLRESDATLWFPSKLSGRSNRNGEVV